MKQFSYTNSSKLCSPMINPFRYVVKLNESSFGIFNLQGFPQRYFESAVGFIVKPLQSLLIAHYRSSAISPFSLDQLGRRK